MYEQNTHEGFRDFVPDENETVSRTQTKLEETSMQTKKGTTGRSDVPSSENL